MRYIYKQLLLVFLTFFSCLCAKSGKRKVKSLLPVQCQASKPKIHQDAQGSLTESCHSFVKTDSSMVMHSSELQRVIPNDVYATDSTATKPRSIQIRVLLTEAQGASSWTLHSQAGFRLIDPLNSKKNISMEDSSITVTNKSGFLFINGRRLTREQVIIMPQKDNIVFDGREYLGSLYIVCQSEKTYLISCIDLEDYVACVLNSEAWPGWPHEMNKVLAIAIRSYGVAMMRQAADNKRLYHVKNSVSHQVYAGTHTNKLLHNAVLETSGIIMTYRNNPIIAMYDACCGGVVTARMKGIDFIKAPYLARKTPCTYCKNCKIYSWSATFDKDELTALFQRDLPSLSRIKSVTISKKDGAGLIQQVSIKCARGIFTLSGKKIFSLKPKIKSYCYSIETKNNYIIFKGRGYGHHVGLCQWGACHMIKNGYNCKQALHFYYPGISFMKIVR